MGDSDYDSRKVLSQEKGLVYIKDDKLKKKLFSLERQHDITDTILFVVFWCNSKRQEIEDKRKDIRRRKIMRSKVIGTGLSTEKFFEQFRYKKSV
jgi:predicted Holliday junction resolvase-like endonuclease